MHQDTVHVTRILLVGVPLLELMIVRVELHGAVDTHFDKPVHNDIYLLFHRDLLPDIVVHRGEVGFDILGALPVPSER